MDRPRLFALCRGVDDLGNEVVVGYGMVLPGGHAYAVSWPAAELTHSAVTAEEIAVLRGAQLLWIEES